MASQLAGSMPPQTFLDVFMTMDGQFPAAPEADFSEISVRSLNDMRATFVRIVDKCGLLPNLRMFTPRMKKRKVWTGPSLVTTNSDAGEPEDLRDLVPALAVRRQPKARRGLKKKIDVVEYYDFATSLLNIELFPRKSSDPWVDVPMGFSSLVEGLSTSSGESSPSSVSHTPSRDCSPSRKPVPSPISDYSQHPQDAAAGPSRSAYNQPLPPGPFFRQTEAADVARTGIAKRARAQFARQHRNFGFHLVLVNKYARFVRWDRSGGVISARFNYRDQPQLLSEFLWRFAQMSEEQRGWDMSVTSPTRAEVRLFTRSVQQFVDAIDSDTQEAPARRLPHARRSLDDLDAYPPWKVHLTNTATGASTDVIVKRPFASHCSLFGRSTRAYLAYDLVEQRLIFLKDSWRPIRPNLHAEFETYQMLESHDIPHLPTVLYGGDVCGTNGQPQKTVTQDLTSADWCTTDCEVHQYFHHRIAQEIAYPVEEAFDDRELLRAFQDILTTIKKVYDTTGILNRDISVRNVMLTVDGRGILNDWDHAGSKDDGSCGIGSWQFMSTRLLRDREKSNDISDDLESVFWSLVYCALRHFLVPDQYFPDGLFDSSTIDAKGACTGGDVKSLYIEQDRLLGFRLTSAALQTILWRGSKAWLFFNLVYNKDPLCEVMARTGTDVQELYNHGVSPVWWVEEIENALKDSRNLRARNGSVEDRRMARLHRDMAHAAHASPKRKADEDTPEPPDVAGPRRSKRLKTKRYQYRSV